MIVAELMTPNPVTVAPHDSLEIAYARMEAGRFRQVPVVDGSRLIGIITDRDLRPHLGYLHRTLVDAVMTTHLVSVKPSSPVELAAHLLVAKKVGSLPVVETGKLVGIITASDLIHALEAILGSAADDSVRIDLDAAGSGEITAAVGLVRSICPVLCIGTYSRKPPDHEVLYLRVPAAGADRAALSLQQYGFKVLTVHRESNLGSASDCVLRD
jgi:acetoin utilization protein AcuB